MVSQANIEFLKQGGRRYIVGTPKSMLRQYDKQLTASDWHVVREGLEVKLCPDPDGGSETFILCRSADRAAKEQAMHQRFQKRIEEGLTALAKLAANRTLTAVALALACRPAAGPEHAGGGLVPDGDRHRRRPRRLKMAEGGSVADVGELE